MKVQRFLLTADHISTWTGKATAWLILVLMSAVCIEVFKRYILNAPTAWIFDLDNMLYGTLFMMCGAYTLAQDAHVRGDFLYGSFKPRTQATLDLVLYILFFLPGVIALIYAGIDYAAPVYPFKTVIPIAGVLVLIQGLAEIVRCIVCLQTGQWPDRLKDAEEIDVIEQQLAGSTLVDEETRKRAIEGAHQIDEAAHQRIGSRGAERE